MEDLEEIWVEIEQLFILKRQRVVVFEGACDELETKRVATVSCEIIIMMVLVHCLCSYWI